MFFNFIIVAKNVIAFLLKTTSKNMLNIVLFKCEKLQKSLTHISTGDVFRKNIKNKTDLGNLAQSYINKHVKYAKRRSFK